MKRQFLVVGALLLICSMVMCINQIQIPDGFIESYGNIQTTQKEIETTYLAYEDQVNKRIAYVESNVNQSKVDSKHLLSLLQSELLIIEEMNQKSALYSKQINDLYNESTNIKNSEAKSKANGLIIDLRSSQQYLAKGTINLRDATQSMGKAINYYATGADITDPLIQQEIQSLDLDSRTLFDSAVSDLNTYYNIALEANATYQEILKM